jgi:alpha-methylacyl-CoA racemase
MAGPLAGLRVVELRGRGPGPFGGMVLADLGAEVLRIDRPDRTPPAEGETESGAERMIRGHRRIDLVSRGRRRVALDLKQPDGVAAAPDLIGRADVLVEGYRPGVAERLGVGPEVCLERNPGLIYARITGWGQDGPYAQVPGHDINYVALAGALDPLRRGGLPPAPPLNLHGMRAEKLWSDVPGSNILDLGSPFYNVYETADGRYVTVGCGEPQFYAALLEKLGLEEELLHRQSDSDSWAADQARLAEVFKTRRFDEWRELLEGTQTCFAPVLTLAEAPSHTHNVQRGTFVEVEGVVQPAPAPRFSRTPPGPPRPTAAETDTIEEVVERWTPR